MENRNLNDYSSKDMKAELEGEFESEVTMDLSNSAGCSLPGWMRLILRMWKFPKEMNGL